MRASAQVMDTIRSYFAPFAVPLDSLPMAALMGGQAPQQQYVGDAGYHMYFEGGIAGGGELCAFAFATVEPFVATSATAEGVEEACLHEARLLLQAFDPDDGDGACGAAANTAADTGIAGAGAAQPRDGVVMLRLAATSAEVLGLLEGLLTSWCDWAAAQHRANADG